MRFAQILKKNKNQVAKIAKFCVVFVLTPEQKGTIFEMGVTV
jgi:hypothetical protein